MSPMLAGVAEKGPEAVLPLDKIKDFIPGTSGPAIHVETANFYDEADMETFLRRAAWEIQTGNL